MSQGTGPLAGLWLGPVLFGGTLILAGIVFLFRPYWLIYLIALALIVAGAGMIAMGMASRVNVTYRRIDGE